MKWIDKEDSKVNAKVLENLRTNSFELQKNSNLLKSRLDEDFKDVIMDAREKILAGEEVGMVKNEMIRKNYKGKTFKTIIINGRHYNYTKYQLTAVRNAIKTTALTTSLARIEEFGVDTIQFSINQKDSRMRPACEIDQGKVCSLSNLEYRVRDFDGNIQKVIPINETTYGEVDGMLGINCRHQLHPYFYDKKL